jgi:hypothetical protein
MAYCTIVEWEEGFDLADFERSLAEVAASSAAPEGRLARIVGADARGARVIEVWRSGEDAQAFARQSAGAVSAASLPTPSRVYGFEATHETSSESGS